jgi:hypothetical protein
MRFEFNTSFSYLLIDFHLRAHFFIKILSLVISYKHASNQKHLFNFDTQDMFIDSYILILKLGFLRIWVREFQVDLFIQV